MSAARRARFSGVEPVAISSATAPLRKPATTALVEAEIRRTDEFALVHRQAAEGLREIFAKADAGHELLGLAKSPFGAHAPGVGGQFARRLRVGRKPGEAVRGVLLGLDQRGVQPPLAAHPVAHGGDRAREQGLQRALRRSGEVVEIHGWRSPIYFGAATCDLKAPDAIRISADAGSDFAAARRGKDAE